MAKQPLEGIKVLDLTNHIAGSYCTKLFADYGASVLKIEKPGRGCLTRSMYPYAGDDPDPDKSLYHLYLNTNKKSLTLNLKSESGQKVLLDLVKETDILVESFAPKVRAALGLDYDTLEQINPRLVMASISNFGQTGPYRDYKASDLIEFAMGGAMSSTGMPGRPPTNKGRDASLFETGVQAWHIIVGVFMGTRKDGIGDYLDFSIMDTELAGCERRTVQLLTYQFTGDSTQRRDPKPVIGIMPRALRCKDGYLNMGVGPTKFDKFLKLIGREDLANDPAWNLFAFDKAEEAMKVYEDAMMKKGKLEWTKYFQDNGIICISVNTAEDVCKDEHWEERGFFVKQDHPVAGEIRMPRGNVHVDPDWWQMKAPAPRLGEHTKEVLTSLGYGKEDIVTLKTQGVI
ncbi:MAG: CoA transferase [Deltaproteobacteria bacterium]|nr:CoA transferase [Deltaproteobacteria bacterium]